MACHCVTITPKFFNITSHPLTYSMDSISNRIKSSTTSHLQPNPISCHSHTPSHYPYPISSHMPLHIPSHPISLLILYPISSHIPYHPISNFIPYPISSHITSLPISHLIPYPISYHFPLPARIHSSHYTVTTVYCGAIILHKEA